LGQSNHFANCRWNPERGMDFTQEEGVGVKINPFNKWNIENMEGRRKNK
jgi:hypothetical protein